MADITQIAQQHPFFQNPLGASHSAVRSFMEEEERWRARLLGPALELQSILDQVSTHQIQLDRYRELFTLAPSLEIGSLMAAYQDHARIEQNFQASKSFIDAIEQNRKLLDQVSRFSDPFLEVVERLKFDQLAPWASQMEATAAYVQKLMQSLSVDDDVDWGELGSHLEGVQSAIEQLPPTGASDQQIRRAGLTWAQWNVVFWLISTLIAILAYLDTHAQGRFAREQAAQQQVHSERAAKEEQAYREQLLAAFASLAEHSPNPPDHYVVGPRAVQVKSAISKGGLLDVAHPNQVVAVTGEHSRWIKIRYRNHLEERDVEGWVLKKYLVRQKASAHVAE